MEPSTTPAMLLPIVVTKEFCERADQYVITAKDYKPENHLALVKELAEAVYDKP